MFQMWMKHRIKNEIAALILNCCNSFEIKGDEIKEPSSLFAY